MKKKNNFEMGCVLSTGLMGSFVGFQDLCYMNIFFK